MIHWGESHAERDSRRCTGDAMQMTRSVSYAVGVLVRLATQPTDRGATTGAMTAAQITKGCKFPPRFLYRVLRRLVDARLIRGVSGPGGGYSLARPATKITLLDIVRAVDGVQPPEKLPAVSSKQRGATQQINTLCRRSHLQFCRQLARVTLAKLAKR